MLTWQLWSIWLSRYEKHHLVITMSKVYRSYNVNVVIWNHLHVVETFLALWNFHLSRTSKKLLCIFMEHPFSGECRNTSFSIYGFSIFWNLIYFSNWSKVIFLRHGFSITVSITSEDESRVPLVTYGTN